MTLEARIEKATCDALVRSRQGVACVKHGSQGWPDRQVLLGMGRHIWVEFKQEGRALRPDQRVRIEQLLAAGDVVFVVDTVDDGLLLAERIGHAGSPEAALTAAKWFSHIHPPTIRALRLPAAGG